MAIGQADIQHGTGVGQFEYLAAVTVDDDHRDVDDKLVVLALREHHAKRVAVSHDAHGVRFILADTPWTHVTAPWVWTVSGFCV